MKSSIAMTAHNSGSYLLEQLDSLKNQTRPADEVIIVDDASTDGTPGRIQDYISENNLDWKLVCSSNGLGYIKAFQKAISLCTHNVIFLCDHDDHWHEDKVEMMMQVFESNPEVSGLACSWQTMDEQSRITSPRHQNLLDFPVEKRLTHLHYRDLSIGNIGMGCSMAFTRDICQQYLENYPDLQLPHDYALAAISVLHGGLYFLNTTLLTYRVHSSNTLGFKGKRDWESRTQTAREEAAQKEELDQLASQLDPEQEALAQKRADWFSRRAELLEQKKPFGLMAHGLKTGNMRLIKTGGMDAWTILKNK